MCILLQFLKAFKGIHHMLLNNPSEHGVSVQYQTQYFCSKINAE